MVQVKICGLTRPEDLSACLEHGADLIGLVFFPESPRNLSLAAAEELAGLARGRTRIVALVVDPADALLDDICARIAPDLIQLHGHETLTRVGEVRSRFATPVMKALPVSTREDVEAASAYYDPGRLADLLLFDARPASPDALPGGNGLRFDWTILEGRTDRTVPFALAGGLTPENVAEAVRLTLAPVVDVSSGVERAPGEKDRERIAAFIAAAKALPNGQ